MTVLFSMASEPGFAVRCYFWVVGPTQVQFQLGSMPLPSAGPCLRLLHRCVATIVPLVIGLKASQKASALTKISWLGKFRLSEWKRDASG